MAIRVLLADDHKIIRDGLRALFANNQELELVGEAADGEQAIRMSDELHPDVVVMDVTMPRVSGPAAARVILERHPDMHIIGLSMHADRYFMDLMKDAGAAGYIAKDAAYDDLADAIRTVHAGGTVFS
jgi:DNA-binding NarL/FixJ family response regulator